MKTPSLLRNELTSEKLQGDTNIWKKYDQILLKKHFRTTEDGRPRLRRPLAGKKLFLLA